MVVTASALRQNIYRLLGEIERKGRRLQIVPERPRSKLDRLIPHPGSIIGDPDELIHLDWSKHWNPLLLDPPVLNPEPNAS
ncbi:MAG: hypothetical protein ACRDTG_27360 [Pseudonocardiaceae bacterium]